MAVVELPELYRPAEGESVIVAALGIADMLPAFQAVAGPCVRERCSGIENLVHEIIVAASMELVAARLHRVIEVPATGLPILRRVVADLYGDFLDGIQARLVYLVKLAMLAVGGILP